MRNQSVQHVRMLQPCRRLSATVARRAILRHTRTPIASASSPTKSSASYVTDSIAGLWRFFLPFFGKKKDVHSPDMRTSLWKLMEAESLTPTFNVRQFGPQKLKSIETALGYGPTFSPSQTKGGLSMLVHLISMFCQRKLLTTLDVCRYSFIDQRLLCSALWHSSAGGKGFLRLAFIGDAALRLAITEELMAAPEVRSRAELNTARSKYECRKTCSWSVPPPFTSLVIAIRTPYGCWSLGPRWNQESPQVVHGLSSCISSKICSAHTGLGPVLKDFTLSSSLCWDPGQFRWKYGHFELDSAQSYASRRTQGAWLVSGC